MTAGRKVVVIEDDDSLRKAIKRLLDTAGFQSLAYDSAEALLASGSDQDAACVVSDLRLPGISGLDLLARLRARGEGAPMILITAHDAPGLREEAAQRGAAAYLVKPFLGTELLTLVTELVASAGSRCR
jgi:FixJ family two-component response regulator